MSVDISTFSTAELLAMHAEVSTELRSRGVTRSANNPTGDLAELIFCRAFGWTQENNSKMGYDASDGKTRYQIKGRRLDFGRGSRQLSAIRNIAAKHFDFLAAVIFNRDYTIWRAAIIPHSLVSESVRRSKHTNSNIFHLRDHFWDHPDVQDVTINLRKVSLP